MVVAVYVPLLAAAVLGVCAPWLVRRLPPATAVPALAGAAVLAALACSFSLVVLAGTLIGQWTPVASLGHWSAAKLSRADPVPRAAALAALSVLPALALLLGHRAWRSASDWLAARRLCRSLGGLPGELLVVDGDRPDAFALAASGGRIVVSRELLRALSRGERRAVLAHEAAHLRHYHVLYRTAADLSAALNPLLRPLAGAVAYGCERWADEEAAGRAGRGQAARALAHAALLGSPAPGVPAGLVLRAASSFTTERVRALLAPAPRRSPAALAVLATLVLALLATTAEAGRDTDVLFERAATGPGVTSPH